MAKYLAGLAAVGVIAFLVKSTADEMGQKLVAARPAPPAAAAPAPAAGDGPATVSTFEDTHGFFRVMVAGAPEAVNPDSTHLHGIGRAYRLFWKDRQLELKVAAEFVGSDEPNTPRQTLAWVVKQDVTRAQHPDLFDRVKFTAPATGVAQADYSREWRGNNPHAYRTRRLLLRRWLYTATAYGRPGELDVPEVETFFESLVLTEKALAHPDGGSVKR